MTTRIFTTFISIFALLFTTYNLKIIEFTKKNFLKNLIIVFLVTGIPSFRFQILLIPIYFIVMIVLLFLENRQIMKNLISIILSIIIVILSDTIQGTLFIEVFKKDIHQILNNKITFIYMHLVLFIIAFLLSSFVSYILKKLKFNFEVINLKNKFSILLFIEIALTVVIFYIDAMMMKFSHIDNVVIYLDSVLFLSYFVFTMIITYIFSIHFKKEIDFKNKKKEFERLQEYTSTLESMYNNMRKFRHDYINILSSMTGYIEQKDLNGLEEFFNTRILPLNDNILKKNFKLEKLQNVKIMELKGLLSSKVIRAQELGIDVFIDIVEPIEFINMDIIDLCRSIGILLDNAIEGAMLCKVPSMKLGIINKKNSIIILIINSCVKDIPPIYKMFQNGFSTKGEGRGLGLCNLKEILSNYDNICFETSIENKEFIQNLQILNS